MSDELAARCAMCRELDLRDCEHDVLPFYAPLPTTSRTVAEPRPCRHPKSARRIVALPDGTLRTECVCGHVVDPAVVRRGKSARRLGGDQERRAERVYGWRKVGEFGGITDLEDELFVVQQKATRSSPPLRWTGIFRALDSRAGGRIPLLLLSFVHQGRDVEDFVVVRGRDWRALHGEPERSGQ